MHRTTYVLRRADRAPQRRPSRTPRARMPKLRTHIRHICRTFYLSEWWNE
jgi:hypothetical protein